MTQPAEAPAPGFDDPVLVARIEAMPPELVDALPFGAVRLDAAGRVTFFNTTERRLSGYGERPTLGLSFFTEIAPCMNRPGFRGRLDQGLASGRVEAHFTWVGDFSDAERLLEVRLRGIPGGGCWLFIRRNGT